MWREGDAGGTCNCMSCACMCGCVSAWVAHTLHFRNSHYQGSNTHY